jgi:hypothetical protein
VLPGGHQLLGLLEGQNFPNNIKYKNISKKGKGYIPAFS